MIVSYATLADFASVDGSGKVTIVGAFNEIRPDSMPYVHPLTAILVILEADRLGENDEVEVDLVLTAANSGSKVFHQAAKIEASERPLGAWNILIALVNGLTYEEYGSYELNVSFDGQIKKTTRIQVIDSSAK